MTAAIHVDVSQRALSDAERRLLVPDLQARDISASMLDLLPPAGRYFQILRAVGGNGQLLGVTSLMSVRPFVSIKQMLGEGNHVGWDTSIYFAPDVDQVQVAGAILRSMAGRSMFYAMYFGQIDDHIRAALPTVRHRLLRTDYEMGHIDCRPLASETDFLAVHKRLRRNIRHHEKSGARVHVVEGPVGPELADGFSELVLSTYRHHGGVGQWKFREYAQTTCGAFFRKCQDAVHIYTTAADGRLTGVQSFIRHPNRLELSEGGFDRTGTDNHHAYEAIIVQSVAYAIARGLEAVGYGGIWNHTKDRYTEKADRPPVYLLQLYPSTGRFRLFGDRYSAWAFRTYFGGRFAGATGSTTIESRLGSLA